MRERPGIDHFWRGTEQVEIVVTGAGSPRDLWWSYLLRGLFALGLGAFAVFWPTESLSILVLAVGIFCAVYGITSLISAMHAQDRRAYLAQALISLGIGIVLVFWPEGSLRILLKLFGVWILFTGIGQFMLARAIPPGYPDRGPVLAIGLVAVTVGTVLILWPASGIVTISWMIGLSALLIGGLLSYLALRFRQLAKRMEDSG